jgi:hypothetical protein
MDVYSDALIITKSVQPLGIRSSAGYTFPFVLVTSLPVDASYVRIYYVIEGSCLN